MTNIPDISSVVQNLQRGVNEVDFGGVQLPTKLGGANILKGVVNGIAQKFGLSLPFSGSPNVPSPSFPSSLPSLPALPTQASPLTIPQVLGGS